MGKSSRAHNARLAELRASQARQERRRRLLLAGAVVAVVLLVAGGLVAVALQGSTTSTSSSTSASGAKRPVPLDQATLTKLTSVPASALDSVGVGSSSNPPKTIDAPALTQDGKPRLVYVGAEYCPFCASERWPVVVALSRFGTWNNLQAAWSAPSPETNPDTPTLTFHGATYTSPYLSFTGYETATNEMSNGQFKPLDTLSGEDQALFDTYSAPPYVDARSKGAIPWLNIAGTSILSGAQWDSTPILDKTQAQIADALSDPSTPTAQGINGAANVLTAQICKSTNQQPSNVCTSPGVVAAAAKL
ncbi:MAG: DUF929 family protein [Dermatophilaceae bacterium]